MADTPGREPEERLPAPVPEGSEVAQGPVAPVERFSSTPATRAVELTPERAAQVVRQSSNARWVGFLAVIVVMLFVAIYWFYEIGTPLGLSEPRLDAEANAQSVTDVERGYNVFEANCARCHGANGEGGIGPALNRQDKLYQHLNANYLNTVLTAGGRYVCGNPNSLMPVWSNQATPPGPLNYRQIQEVIAFIRSDKAETYVKRDPEFFTPMIDPLTGKVETFNGWVDTSYQPAPGSTPYPACWTSEFAAPSAAPAASGSPAASGAPAPSASAGAAVLEEVAQGIAFTNGQLTAPANQPFQIRFQNEDAGTPHDITIKDSTGAVKFKGQTFPGPNTMVYDVPALPAGTYPFVCSVHSNMTGTLTVQ